MLPFITHTTDFDENHINVHRQVTKEEDPLEYNIEHGKGNYGGDMMLTPEQMEWIKGDGKERSLINNPYYRWPKTGSSVSYTHLTLPTNREV